MQQNGILVYRVVRLRHLSPTLRHFRGPIPVCWIPMDTNSTIPLHWIKTYLWQEESFNFCHFQCLIVKNHMWHRRCRVTNLRFSGLDLFIYIYNNVFPTSPQAGFSNVSRPLRISPDRPFSMTGIWMCTFQHRHIICNSIRFFEFFSFSFYVFLILRITLLLQYYIEFCDVKEIVKKSLWLCSKTLNI